MVRDPVGSAIRPSAFQKTAAAESPQRADDGSHALFLSELEVQAVADTNPIALRTLFLPDYDGIATSFAGLLQRVVQRCKWDGQASGYMDTYTHTYVLCLMCTYCTKVCK